MSEGLAVEVKGLKAGLGIPQNGIARQIDIRGWQNDMEHKMEILV